MERPEGPQPNQPQPTRQERMQALDDLSKKFGGSARIPEGDLTSIGYIRKITDDGTIRLTPQELIAESGERKKSLKEQERPFDRIAVELPTADQSFRFIPRDQSQLLMNKLQGVEYAFYPNWNDGEGTSILGSLNEIDPRLHNIRAFAMDFLGFLQEQGIDGRKVSDILGQFLLFTPLPVRRESKASDGPDYPDDFLHGRFLREHAEEDSQVSSLQSRNMFDELTRLGGYYADVTVLTDDFRRRLAEPNIIEGQAIIDREEVAEYLHSLNIYTNADFIKYVFPKYLKHIGLPQIGEAVERTSDLSTIPDDLTNLDTSNDFREEEARLRQSLKTATPEERNTVSGRLKEIDTAKKKRTQIRNGVIDYFASPQVYAEVCRRKIKEAQDFLVTGKGKRIDKALFYLDARPNAELDKDPGAISGDCTAGIPLPFDRADILAYNVKVFTAQEQHIGNMYLLVTKEGYYDTMNNVEAVEQANKDGGKVWHLDAIQIPTSGIDWDAGVPALVNSLATASETKGVETITVNSEEHLISNYDYIQKSVRKYWDETSKEEADIIIPDAGDLEKYSSFQSNGQVLILWKKELPMQD